MLYNCYFYQRIQCMTRIPFFEIIEIMSRFNRNIPICLSRCFFRQLNNGKVFVTVFVRTFSMASLNEILFLSNDYIFTGTFRGTGNISSNPIMIQQDLLKVICKYFLIKLSLKKSNEDFRGIFVFKCITKGRPTLNGQILVIFGHRRVSNPRHLQIRITTTWNSFKGKQRFGAFKKRFDIPADTVNALTLPIPSRPCRMISLINDAKVRQLSMSTRESVTQLVLIQTGYFGTA